MSKELAQKHYDNDQPLGLANCATIALQSLTEYEFDRTTKLKLIAASTSLSAISNIFATFITHINPQITLYDYEMAMDSNNPERFLNHILSLISRGKLSFLGALMETDDFSWSGGRYVSHIIAINHLSPGHATIIDPLINPLTPTQIPLHMLTKRVSNRGSIATLTAYLTRNVS